MDNKADMFVATFTVEAGGAVYGNAGSAVFDRRGLMAARGGPISEMMGRALGEVGSVGTVILTITAMAAGRVRLMSTVEVTVEIGGVEVERCYKVNSEGVWDVQLDRGAFGAGFVMAVPYDVRVIHDEGVRHAGLGEEVEGDDFF